MSRGLRRPCAKGCRLDWLYLTRMDQRQRPELYRVLGRVRTAFAGWPAYPSAWRSAATSASASASSL